MKVSVIIPVYNVQQYLRRCVDSVLAQTFQSLEVILIDDGSADQSGKICDGYQAADPRVRVIHQSNQGLSQARNAGIRAASGDFLCFVDSDDYIGRRHIEYLLSDAVRYDADVSVCGFRIGSGDAELDEEIPKEKAVCYTPRDAVCEMLYARHFSVSAWGKLYRRNLFDGIQYPPGLLFEDLASTYRIVLKGSRVVFANDRTYCYFQRPGSLTNSLLTEHHFRCYRILEHYFDVLPETGEFRRAVSCQYAVITLSFYKSVKEKKTEKMLWSKMRPHIFSVLFNAQAPARARVFAGICCFGPYAAGKMIRLYYRRKTGRKCLQ